MTEPDHNGHDPAPPSLRVGIDSETGNVVLVMSRPLSWLSLPPQVALELAQLIEAQALQAGATRLVLPAGQG